MTAALDESLREGRPDAELMRRQAALEASVRRRALRARGASDAIEEETAIDGALPSSRGRSLVDFVALDGRLLAVTVVDGRARLRELGDAVDIEREVESLRMSLRSLATAPAGSRAAAAMGDVCDAVARKLDALLFGPMRTRRRAAHARADRRAARAPVVDAARHSSTARSRSHRH